MDWAGVESVSYATAALAFGVLILLLVRGSEGAPRKGLFLLIACAVQLVWALWYAYASYAGFGVLGHPVSSAMEVLRAAGWLVFLTSLARLATGPLHVRIGRRHWDGWKLMFPAAIVVFAAGLALLSGPIHESGSYPFALLLVAPLAGLFSVEQVFRRSAGGARWGIKHLCMGLALILAFDFFLFAEALLFGGVRSPVWESRGLVNALAVPLIAVSAARHRAWDFRIGVSRKVVTESLVLTAAGVYLIFMAAAGYYVQYFGGNWGGVLQVVIVCGAIVFATVLTFSGSVRARARVFVSKHFYSYKFDYRDEWRRFIATISDHESGQTLRVRALRALGQIMDSPGGALWSSTDTGHFMLSATWNMNLPGTAVITRDEALPKFLRERQWVVDLGEFEDHPERYDRIRLPAALADLSNIWAIVPLFQIDVLLGFAVLKKPIAPRALDWESRDLLKLAGREVAGYIELMDKSEALVDARQFEAFNRLSAFVVHDLNNVQAQLSLVTRNAKRLRDNPEFVDDAFRTVESAAARMSRVLEHLARAEHDSGEGRQQIDLRPLLDSVAWACTDAGPPPSVIACSADEEPLRVSVQRGRLMTVMEHLVRNAQQAAGADGVVTLSVSVAAPWAVVEIADNGCGMEEAFLRERLFRPFDTSKGNAGMGIGVFEARQFAESSGGVIEVWSQPGEGTRVQLWLPLADTPEGAVSGGSSHD